MTPIAEPILDFESEFIQLAAWLGVRFDEVNKIPRNIYGNQQRQCT